MACFSQGLHFGVSGGVVQLNRLVPAFGNTALVPHQHGTHRHFALLFGPLRQPQGVPHPLLVGHSVALPSLSFTAAHSSSAGGCSTKMLSRPKLSSLRNALYRAAS